MFDDHSPSPPSLRQQRIRSGLAWLAAAALLVPARMLLEGMVPSIENTVVDDVPTMLLVMASGVFAVAGVARLVQAMRTPRGFMHDPHYDISDRDVAAVKARLDAARQSHVALGSPYDKTRDTARRVTERYHTPV